MNDKCLDIHQDEVALKDGHIGKRNPKLHL
jgi:hypothetical protein